MIKPGLQTTEFYLTLVGMVVTLLAALGLHVTLQQDQIASIATTLALAAQGIAYVVSRTMLKSRVPLVSAQGATPAPPVPPVAPAQFSVVSTSNAA